MSNKKQSSKDLNLATITAVNNIYNKEVKIYLNEVNGTMSELKEKNLKLISHFIFNVYKEVKTLDIAKIKSACKSEAINMPSLFTWYVNDKGTKRCDLYELLSAFTFSEFVESKITDKTSVKAIRKALDKFNIEGLSGAVKIARKYKKDITPKDLPSTNRPDTDKIVSSAEKMDSLNLSKSDVKEALMNLDITEALQICKEFIEDNAQEVKKVS